MAAHITDDDADNDTMCELCEVEAPAADVVLQYVEIVHEKVAEGLKSDLSAGNVAARATGHHPRRLSESRGAMIVTGLLDIDRERQLDKAGRVIKVVPVVKTQPTPSRKYVETVCVAGIALDPLRWVRLYPIAFRYLDNESSFQKYETLEVAVRGPENDFRVESLKLTSDPKVLGGPIAGWDQRYELMPDLAPESLCELRQRVQVNRDGQSLAAIEPRERPTVVVEPHPGWSSAQKESIRQWAGEDLFGHKGKTLNAPRFRVRLKFKCLASTCNGHSLSLIDWEAQALERRFKDKSIDYAREQFRVKFIDEKFKHGKKTLIIVGNQHDPVKRLSFMALGIFGPFTDPTTRLF